ncbi:CDK-activating kinase assembly factor MAT1-like [Oppia nitens]|uniref:CDK-activating kinase assembly factor MAT1-like n=1 Tax=Oppia nitens TaxID=1686743 RepID=UPI0023DAFF0F|nr:CDK-activating kinase assembly factor MAT1-like [Oppia nitens]
MDEEIKCPHCGSTKYRNPSLKLMVNVCGHALCETCVDRLFMKGSGQCPQCNVNLRRTNFRLQLFEDHLVEKEVDIRKRILKDFNKKQEDFASLEEFNNYLELIETIVFNLTNDVDILATNKLIDNYKKENATQIIKSRSRLSKDEELIEELLEQERQQTLLRTQLIISENKESAKSKVKLRESLADELMFSDASAQQILANHNNEMKVQSSEMTKNMDVLSLTAKQQTKAFSTGILVGKGSNVFDQNVRQPEGKSYVYKSPHFEINGPDCPHLVAIQSNGYLNNVRPASGQDLAGGFLTHFPCHRALQEAFCGLYFKI